MRANPESYGKSQSQQSASWESSPYQGKGNAKTGGGSGQVCRDYQNGQCKRNDCKFAHICETCKRPNCWPKKKDCPKA